MADIIDFNGSKQKAEAVKPRKPATRKYTINFIPTESDKTPEPQVEVGKIGFNMQYVIIGDDNDDILAIINSGLVKSITSEEVAPATEA